tara:strand:+ start:7735 stop:7962 length:228 start_codon:yes stop_codon:yes gene_type:complete
MKNWKKIFKDNNSWNEKSIIGFIAFMVLLVVIFVDLIFAVSDITLVVNQSIYDALLWLVIGCFGISGIQKFSKKN